VELNITIHRGKSNAPLAVLIHGLGVDKGIWTDPLHTKLLANNIRLKILAAEAPLPRISAGITKLTIGDFPHTIDNIWSVLKDEGYNLITWSQKRPVGHVDAAVSELKDIVLRAEVHGREAPSDKGTDNHRVASFRQFYLKDSRISLTTGSCAERNYA